MIGDEKAKESDRAGGAGVDMGKSLLLHVVDHLKERREVEFQFRILKEKVIAGIALSAGVLTVHGNRTSHAAVVARQLGKGCITGCSGLRIDIARRAVIFDDRPVAEGELITLDSNTGHVFAGEVEIVIDYPTPWLDEIRKWR